jgi:DNA/RNA endonuclease YhcR with UshA esterase domain
MRRGFLIVAIVALAAVSVYGHHSYGATYDTSKQVKLEGKVVGFQLRNPHSFVTLEAKDEGGTMQRWAIEWSGTTQLTNSGVKKDSLKVGDDVVVTGRPSRVPGEYRVLMVTLKRPSDGFSWGTRAGEAVD